MGYTDREDFFLQLLADYALLNEIVTGPLNRNYLDKVGIKYGLRVEDAYRKSSGTQEKLTPRNFGDLIVNFLNRVGSECTVRMCEDDKLILTCFSCAFGHMVLKSPALCRIMNGIFGGIAARNFSYSKVCVESCLPMKAPSCQVVFYLEETVQSVAAAGTVYTDNPSSYLLTRNEVKVLSDELVSGNNVYGKYLDNLRELESIHRSLEAEYNQLRNEIFSDLGLGILTVNEAGKITYMNKIAQDLLRAEASWDTAVTQSFQSLLRDTLQSGTRYNQYELTMTFANDRRYYTVNTAPLYHNDSNIAGVVSVFQDVTNKKHLEQELLQVEKFALVAELAAGTAHEIRNPITTLRGFLQFLSKESKYDSKGLEYYKLMIEEIDRVNSIIKEFLLLTKPAAPNSREADLHVILEDIFLLIESRTLLENVDLERKYTRSLPLVKVDAAQIKQVFLNLATNAVQAMPSGGKLTISTFAAGGKAYVRFADTGTGIEEKHLKRVFDPFFTTKEQGTGLGLSISYRIIEAHGGRLSLESQPGEGTVFTVELPAIASET